jgi:hypothetical protein
METQRNHVVEFVGVQSGLDKSQAMKAMNNIKTKI